MLQALLQPLASPPQAVLASRGPGPLTPAAPGTTASRPAHLPQDRSHTKEPSNGSKSCQPQRDARGQLVRLRVPCGWSGHAQVGSPASGENPQEEKDRPPLSPESVRLLPALHIIITDARRSEGGCGDSHCPCPRAPPSPRGPGGQAPLSPTTALAHPAGCRGFHLSSSLILLTHETLPLKPCSHPEGEKGTGQVWWGRGWGSARSLLHSPSRLLRGPPGPPGTAGASPQPPHQGTAGLQVLPQGPLLSQPDPPERSRDLRGPMHGSFMLSRTLRVSHTPARRVKRGSGFS